MKNGLNLIVFIMFMGTFGYGQSISEVANSKGKNALELSKKTGDYNFIFPENTNEESVIKAGSYYKEYFTVDFNQEDNSVIIKLIENTVTSRTIISRFLAVNNIKFVELDDKNISLNQFTNDYLK